MTKGGRVDAVTFEVGECVQCPWDRLPDRWFGYEEVSLIRDATENDIQNLSALAIQVWLHTYAKTGIRDAISGFVFSKLMPAEFLSILASENKKVLVAVEEEHLIGFVTVDLDACCSVAGIDGYEIATLYVQEHFKGRGIGTALLDRIRKRYGDEMWLTTWVHNTSALGFYEEYGFTRAGVTFFHLEGEKHENVVLSI